METIIHQITTNLTNKILEKIYSGGISDIDAFSSDALEDCKEAAREILEAVVCEMNLQIRKDKEQRKARGFVLKEKNRPRRLLTMLGELNLPRDYYHDKKRNHYVYLLDQAIGIAPYTRIAADPCAKLATYATEVSYAKSAQIVTDGNVSRQTVRNKILELGSIEKTVVEDSQKRAVKELHVFADEDHVHMQKPGKEKGKRNQIVPLVTVTEGIEEVSGRNRTINPVHFVDEKFDTKQLWKSVEGYIAATYDVAKLECIYLHADGGRWIKNGLENFSQVTKVMDGFHFEKELRKLSRLFPRKRIRYQLREAIKGNDKGTADRILQALYSDGECEKWKQIAQFGNYLWGHWDAICNRLKEDMTGSCTEGQVSHVLSERFSRDPAGWSKEGLGCLTKQRVFLKNQGKITSEDFKGRKQEQTCYADYATQVVENACQKAKDWSLFETSEPIFDGASGTQVELRKIGMRRNTLFN